MATVLRPSADRSTAAPRKGTGRCSHAESRLAQGRWETQQHPGWELDPVWRGPAWALPHPSRLPSEERGIFEYLRIFTARARKCAENEKSRWAPRLDPPLADTGPALAGQPPTAVAFARTSSAPPLDDAPRRRPAARLQPSAPTRAARNPIAIQTPTTTTPERPRPSPCVHGSPPSTSSREVTALTVCTPPPSARSAAGARPRGRLAPPRMGRCPVAGLLHAVSIPEAAASLESAALQIRDWLDANAAGDGEAPGRHSQRARYNWARVELELDAELDVLERGLAVGTRPSGERVFFKGRDAGSLEVCGWGFAAKMTGSPDDQDRICEMVNAAQDSTLRFYGGMRFDQDQVHSQPVPEPWAAFATHTFVLPVLELHHHPSRRKNPILALNLRCNAPLATSTARQILNDFVAAIRSPYRLQEPDPARTTRLLDPFPQYADAMNQVMSDLAAGAYQKLVLVRRRAFDFDQQPDPLAIAAALYRKIGAGYLFCLQLDAETAFLGCSPERLFQLNGNSFATEAMAGTVRRKAGEPSQAERKLRNSAKDLLEHKYVVDYIMDVLRSTGASVESSGPEIVQLPHLLHLQTEINGDFHANGFHCPVERAFSLLRYLHPTPAVCGMPRKETIARIPSLERFDRGFYAGPFGYFGLHASEFCVAIRSALVRRQTLIAYAGGGIVRASVTKSEWDEGELKMSTMTALLAPRPRPCNLLSVPVDLRAVPQESNPILCKQANQRDQDLDATNATRQVYSSTNL